MQTPCACSTLTHQHCCRQIKMPFAQQRCQAHAGIHSTCKPLVPAAVSRPFHRRAAACQPVVMASAAADRQLQPQQQSRGSTARQRFTQGQQQQQQPRQQQSMRRVREDPLPPPLSTKPFLVRVAGRTSSIQGAAGAIVKRLRTEDLVRVAAIDGGSVSKAVLALTAANNMLAANTGQMAVFQPTVINTDAEAPRVPQGAVVMYTGAVMQGEVMAFNVLKVMPDTELRKLAGAIVSRVKSEAHTVLECYGAIAVATAVRAVAQARKTLLANQQDVSCVIASGRLGGSLPDAAEAADAAAAAAPAAAVSGGGGSSSSSKYPATCHRLVVLECQPRKPRALLVSSSMGMTDRVQPGAAGPAPQAPAAADQSPAQVPAAPGADAVAAASSSAEAAPTS